MYQYTIYTRGGRHNNFAGYSGAGPVTLHMKITVFWDEILYSLVPIYQSTCFPIAEGNKLAMRTSNLT
jgi:hypothetical protein